MVRRNTLLTLSLVLGIFWAFVTQVGDATLLVSPLWLLGAGLRTLSLSGTAGNGVAWAIVVILTAFPLGYLGIRRYRGCLTGADWLLPILSAQIGSLLYFLVNPTLTHYPSDLPLADGFALIYIWALVATGVGYGLLRLLGRVDQDATSGRLLPRLLTFGGLTLVLLSGYNHLALLLVHIQTVTESNTGDVSFTVVALSLLALCDLIPALLGGVTLLWSADVATALMADPYGEDTISLCHTVANWCNRVAVTAILVSVSCNLAQILLASQLYQINITIHLPLLTLLLSASLYLLCHYIQEAKMLSDENDSII